MQTSPAPLSIPSSPLLSFRALSQIYTPVQHCILGIQLRHLVWTAPTAMRPCGQVLFWARQGDSISSYFRLVPWGRGKERLVGRSGHWAGDRMISMGKGQQLLRVREKWRPGTRWEPCWGAGVGQAGRSHLLNPRNQRKVQQKQIHRHRVDQQLPRAGGGGLLWQRW